MWEYKTVYWVCDVSNLETFLNNEGKRGWEMISLSIVRESMAGKDYIIVFKRPKTS